MGGLDVAGGTGFVLKGWLSKNGMNMKSEIETKDKLCMSNSTEMLNGIDMRFLNWIDWSHILSYFFAKLFWIISNKYIS